MSERKSYGQFCGLARSLDRIGDRWTLLVVRELLIGDRSFRDLEATLAGIGPTLLTKRLGELVDDGLAIRSDAPRRSKSVEYRLTDEGRALEPVIVELIRWGARWMLSGPGSDGVDPRWAPLALRALLGRAPARRGRIHLDVDGVPVTIAASAGRREITPGHRGRPDAIVHASLPAFLAIANGVETFDGSGAAVEGDALAARRLLAVSDDQG